MGARRLGSVIPTLIAGVACALSVGAGSAYAATQFGSYGLAAEQLGGPVGLAVDTSGDIYVGDQGDNRIDKFDASENWLLAWGGGVLDGAPEMQTCTDICRMGSQLSPAEAFEQATGVAVDNNPLSSSFGDVYVIDEGHSRVEKFDPSGKFILMFGGRVNQTTGEDICRVGEKCTLYAETGTGDGEFSYMPASGYNSFIAIGPAGNIYVGDTARVEVFESSGAWKENISLATLSGTGRPTALAVDATGDIYLKDAGVTGVRELEPNGTEKTTELDPGSTTVTALSIDLSSGHVFVGDSSGGFHINEYDSTAKELVSFARNTVTGQNGGIAFSTSTGYLYASEAHTGFGEEPQTSIWTVPLPPSGPAIDGQTSTPELRGAATLQAQINPEGNETTVHFQYVDDAHFHESGYATATSTTPVSVGSGFEDQTTTASLTLSPGTVYHFRVIATNSQGTATGEDESFQEIPAALIEGPFAANVASTSATLEARIDPQGPATTYSLEYGTTAAYEYVITGNVGEGTTFLPISDHIQELHPATTYHYRIVTKNEVGTWQSSDQTFTTEVAGGAFALPDGRSWELVSPAEKHGALIEPELLTPGLGGEVQAAVDGGGITYQASEPITTNFTDNSSVITQVISRRGTDGVWTSNEIGLPQNVNETEDQAEAESGLRTNLPQYFSSDLAVAAIEPGFNVNTLLSPEATEKTIYLQNTSTGSYTPLVTANNVPPGTKFGGNRKEISEIKYLFATPDLSHVLFASPAALTKEALAANCGTEGCYEGQHNLYEWSSGQLQLVNILPDGKPLQPSNVGPVRVGLGRFAQSFKQEVVQFAMADDGRFVVWSQGRDSLNPSETIKLYVRDMVDKETVPFGGPYARFDQISSDGSRVVYWENGDLYDFDLRNRTEMDITGSHGTREKHAGVIDRWWMGPSEDGTYMYFVATGVLAPGAKKGVDNLYVAHDSSGQWTVTYIAALAKNDQFFCFQCETQLEFEYMNSRVSPNGHYLAFMSSLPLTGYDNSDAVSGMPDEEVYLYDAVSNRLVCASCNPTSARPAGVFDGSREANSQDRPMVDRVGAWREHWIAADIPTWRGTSEENIMQYQPRFLSNGGRLFFNSLDSLAPQDTNGMTDVYEYEPVASSETAVGDNCSNGSSTFSRRANGCINLISSGTSSGESGFMDASKNGNDAFFATASKLVPGDFDSSYDVYDAHVCTLAVPCPAPVQSPPPCTSGDSCKAAPTPQPDIFGPTPSATFSGTGNVPETAPNRTVTPRAATRTQKLARALRACRKRPKRKRAVCERQARKRYGVKRGSRAKSTRRGGR